MTMKATDEDVLPPLKVKIRWERVAGLVLVHVCAAIGLYRCCVGNVRWPTVVYAYCLTYVAGLGITAGAHRLWTHRAFKATPQLNALLVFLNLVSYQTPITEWVLDHHVHHKYSETVADPHNIRRGFFFAHIGWLLVEKQHETTDKYQEFDMRYLTDNAVIRFQCRFFLPLAFFCCYFLAPLLPVVLWSEDPLNSLLVAGALRHTIQLNAAWTVNSFAHLWGERPYDAKISPSENLFVAFLTWGDGGHNFHHTFPWDYASGDFGRRFNFTTAAIEFFAWIGWASNLRLASKQLVDSRRRRTGCDRISQSAINPPDH